MKIVICRHAEPDYEHDSLTEKGKKEAALLASRICRLKDADFYVSPLGRARETASYTLKSAGKNAETLEWLHEFKGKIRTGIKTESCWDRLPSYWTEIPEYYSYENWYKTDLMKSFNVKKEYEKVCKGIDSLMEKYGYIHKNRHYSVENSNHSTIVLFCHFAVECVIMSRIIGISPMPLWHNFVALPSSVTTLISEEREKGIAQFRCTEFGDTSHLYAAGENPSFSARFCECYDDNTRH
ncbi:MAG: histidine phosphatase family protein [Clostridiales bacterium]|nr:histidine phosphatase family protein [Clostridiales bacterium]